MGGGTLFLILNINNGLGGSTPVPVLDAAAKKFDREPVVVIKLTVDGDLTGSQTFLFSPKDGRPLSILYTRDIRPYLLSFRGRPSRIKPDRALTERNKLTLTMADDPNAPDFKFDVFSVFKGGSFWRRLVVAQPDYVGSDVEILLGYIDPDVTFDDFRRIFKGRLEDIDFQSDQSVSLVVKDDLVFSDREVPAEIGDTNLVDGAVGAADATITVDDGEQITDPANLASKDLWPVVARLEPDTGSEEDVILNSRAADVFNVQANFLLRSEEFDNAAWTKNGATVSADQGIGPFGGDARADILNLTAPGSYVEQDSGEVGTSLQFVFSTWLRLGPSLSGGGQVALDLILSDGSELATLNVQVTADWQRFEIETTFVAGAGQTVVARMRRPGGGIGQAVAYGAQLEKAAARGFYAATAATAGAAAGRGQFGTTATTHVDDSVYKEVVPYRLHQDPESGVHPVVSLRDLVNRGSIAVADVDQSTFDGEFAFIESVQVKRTLDAPAKLSDTIKELREQMLLDLWVGEDGLVKARFSFRQNFPGANVKRISDEDNVRRQGSSYKGNAESRTTRVFTYYNLIPGEDGTKPKDFSNVQVVVDLAIEAKSGQKAKTIFGNWLFRAADALAVGGRFLSRFKRGARVSSWSLDLKDEPDFFVGDVIEFDSNEFLVASGNDAARGSTQWQVVRKSVRRRQGRVDLEGLQFSGLRYGIISPANGLENPSVVFPDHQDASGRERQYGFIGDINNKVSELVIAAPFTLTGGTYTAATKVLLSPTSQFAGYNHMVGDTIWISHASVWPAWYTIAAKLNDLQIELLIPLKKSAGVGGDGAAESGDLTGVANDDTLWRGNLVDGYFIL